VTSQRVVVVGDVMLDVVVRPHGPLAPTSDTPSSIRMSRGGSGANVAIALRRTGHQVRFVGAAGDDSARHVFQQAMNDAGIATQFQLARESTGTVVSLVAADGRRMMLTDRGANGQLSEDFVAECLEFPYDHLHISGYLLLDRSTRNLAEHALLKAQQFGRTTSLDVCSVAPLREVTPDVFLRAATYASKLFANEEEAVVLTQATNAGEGLEILAQLFDEVVITLGAGGAIAARGTERYHASALEVAVVDTTGAGDAATGAYVGARLHGESPEHSLALAMEAASAVVGGLGALG
jgi:sugar/nucleoside kinase (ribokinase family)